MASRTLRLCGLEWKVHFVENHPDFPETSEGFTMFSSNSIFVRTGMPESRMVDTLLHEVMHAFLDSSGVATTLAANFSGKDFPAFEEALIRLLVPAVRQLIKDNGKKLLSVPKKRNKPIRRANQQ